MWFQALEFSVSCTAAKRFFVSAAERSGGEPEPEATSKFLLLVLHQKEKWLEYNRQKKSSAWNHIFKVQRRVLPRRRTRKVLSLFGTLTGVHQGGHICPAEFWLDGNVRSQRRQTKSPRKKKRRQTCFQRLCCRDFFLCFEGSATQV